MQVFEYLPDFAPGRTETIGPNVRPTPAICRVCQMLREDALPLFARYATFIVQTDGDLDSPNNRLRLWLDAFEGKPLAQVQSLQLSRHWNIKQPARWQGHVGFYIRLQLRDQSWECTCGTYPIVNDIRGMRLECVDLIRQLITHKLGEKSSADERSLSRKDLEFYVETMDVVATHPISTYDMEQTDSGRQRRRLVFREIEQRLSTIENQAWDESTSRTRFFTPY
jgi:hypothetical protein